MSDFEDITPEEKRKAAKLDRQRRWRATPEGKAATLRYTEKSKARRAAYHKSAQGKAVRARYESSEKGKAATRARQHRYDTSDKGREAQGRYRQSKKRKAALKRYNDSEKGHAARAKYAETKKGKAAINRYHDTDKYREYQREYQREYRKNKPVIITRIRAWQENHPERIAAHEMVRTALRLRYLVKKPCEVCGNPKVDAHHDDYSKPLEVHWLCRMHHKRLHMS